MKLPRLWSALALASASLLGGCGGEVISPQPLFGAKDAATRDAPRAGWWVMVSPEEACGIDLAKPTGQWPDCARPVLLSGRMAGKLTVSEGEGDAVAIDYLLAAGDPMILQASLSSPPGDSGGYTYHALRPTRRDARGRPVEIAVWPVLCGPSAPRAPSDGGRPGVTAAPWPSVEISGGGCRVRDLDGLRDAARRSESLSGGAPLTVRWLRERRAGDQTDDQWLAKAMQ